MHLKITQKKLLYKLKWLVIFVYFCNSFVITDKTAK